MGSIAEPLLANGSRKAALKIAKAQQEEAKLTFRQTLLDAGNEVNNALASCQASKAKIDADSMQVEHLAEAVEKIGLMMRYSSTNYLEVLVAQQSLLDAELSLAQEKAALLQACVSLYKAVGGGAE